MGNCRGGIEAVPKGSGKPQVLGLICDHAPYYSPAGHTEHVAGFWNEFVTLIKESSLLSTLAIAELTMVGQQVRSVTYASFETFIMVGLIYLCLTSFTSIALQLIEKRWQVH